jgi:hypothetical protein
MKIKSLFVAVLLAAGVVVAPQAAANEKPVIESFTFTPTEVEISGASTTVNFEFVVSHPAGIENTITEVSLVNSRNDNLTTTLRRTDVPVNPSLTKVTFKGSLEIPRGIAPGVFEVSVGSVKNNASAGYKYETGSFTAGKIRKLIGAESGLLVRSFGDLNLDYVPFNGPAYDTALGVAYDNSAIYNAGNVPIWKVGETYDPLKYYELRVPTLPLKIATTTPSVCTSDGKIMSFVKEGNCAFTVSTAKTSEYPAKTSSQYATITPARVKIQLVVEKVADQTDVGLPKTIELNRVYGASSGWILPKSETPTICIAAGFFVKLLAPGNCKLSYVSPETETYRASDIYIQSFEILKDGKPYVVPSPVVTPTPVATPTAKPVVKKTITCVKGKKTVKKTAVSPKCPAGYKLKK